MRKELGKQQQQLADPHSDVTITGTLADIRKEVDGSVEPRALLDANLTILAASKSLCTLLGQDRKHMVGKRHAEIPAPASEAIGWLYSHALATRLSPPEFEVVSEGKDGIRHVFRISIAPFSPTDTREYFLFVTVHDVTDLSAQMRKLDARISKLAKGGEPPQEPSLLFLLKTLVPRRTIHERKDVSYLTLASWRQAIRAYQLEALKALKQNIPPELSATVATCMAQEINSLIGASAFRAVVPMPCGHSAAASCLSREIARSLAALLNLPVVPALRRPRKKAHRTPRRMSAARR